MNESVHIIQAPPAWLKPPLSLAFLESYLKKKEIKVQVTDLNQIIFQTLNPPLKKWLSLDQEWERNFFFKIKNQHPQLLENICKKVAKSDFVGFTLFKRNLHFSFSLAEEIRKFYPEKKIIFGGPQTLFLDKNKLLDEKNYWVVGEGEAALKKIVQGSEKKIHRFLQVNDLDSLPFYDFDFHQKYTTLRQLPLFSSRGCLFQCKFCSEHQLYKKFRCHSPEYMADQIFHLMKKHKTNHFIFSDSLLNHSSEWLESFCKLIIKNKTDIKWEAQFRVDKNLSLNLAKLIKKSGCYNLFIGLESASQEVLTMMQKKITPAQALAFFKVLRAAGLHFEISLIFGYPGETPKNFEETLDFLIKNKKIIPKIAQVNPFVDYFRNFCPKTQTSQNSKARVSRFLQIAEKEKIIYTKNFINNLIY